MKRFLPGRSLKFDHLSTFGNIDWERQLCGFRFSETRHGAGTRIPKHSHEVATINFVLHGEYRESCAGTNGQFEQYEVLYKPPGEPHSNNFGQSHARCLLIEISSEKFRDLVGTLNWLNHTVQISKPGISTAAFRLISELDSPEGSTAATFESGVLDFLLAVHDDPERNSARMPPWLRNVKEFLEANCHGDYTLTEIASEFGVHVTHLAREFRQHFSQTVGGFVRSHRLENASRLLLNSRQSISEIAFDCGFADQSHFGRWFKKAYGFTPREFRVRYGRQRCVN